MPPLRVLIVEDSETDTELMLRALKAGGFEPVHERVESAEAMRAALQRETWDIVLSDYFLPTFDAPGALALLQELKQDVPFLVVSGSVGEDSAVAAMKAGAHDYVMKDRLQRLAPAVSRAVAEAGVRRESRRLEEQLRLSQKLEAVGRLAGGVAHDFNNALTAILGSTELMILDTPAGGAKRDELEIIQEAATHAQDLVRQLLAFSSRQLLKPVVLDLNSLVRNVGKMLRRLIGENIKLDTALALDLGTVCADPGQLEQVLVNLAVNARDAMPNGGRLTIETRNAELDGVRHIALIVSDTGSGMDAATLAHAFEPFFTTKPRGKGTGLGLATVYGIVRQSAGRIDVESTPGAGATFRILLPRVEEPAAGAGGGAAVSDVAAPRRGTETVLVVEDESLVRTLARKALEQAGYRVLLAAGGEEALEVAERHEGTIDLLMTDVVLPGLSGMDLARRLVQRHPGLRVLFTSGYPDEDVAREGVFNGGMAYLKKPFTPSTLTGKIREVLDARA
jgi:two-component system, cell cycle sensor histidine kinase and response regulator CckA